MSVAQGLPMGPAFPRFKRPPAADQHFVPLRAVVISTAGHVAAVALIVTLSIWGPAWPRSRVQIVNLVPAIAAVGNPGGSAASLPNRTLTPPSARAAEPEPEPRQREAIKPTEPALPARSASQRAGEKELPPMSSDRRPRAPGEATSRPQAAAALGQTTGSAAGVGSLTVDVTDFPHAWYLRQVLAKVQERWQSQKRGSEPDQKPLIWVEIHRDGSITPPRIERSSGNAFYDQAALRAIMEASPFPQLPADWTKPSLRVLFNFELRRG